MAQSNRNRINEYKNSGFGSKTDHQPARLLNQDGTVNVVKTGLSFFDHFSIFHFLVTTNWVTFNLLVIATYLAVNMLFGLVYWGIGIKHGTNFEDFLESVYFSAQTFSIVGYGRANPGSHLANFIAFSEMLIGMMYLALAAGLLFARFSRPVAKIVFSKKAVIAPYGSGTGFMLRLSNAKTNLLLDVEAKVLLSITMNEDGKSVRKFYDLPLEMNKINMLALSWTIVHPIDGQSPLRNFDKETFHQSNAEFMVLIKGFNNTLSQNVHSRTSYKHYDVVWDAKFSPIFSNHHGMAVVELDKIGEYKRVNWS
ncbi:MAG: ion channel [Cytophagales bacterium]|nr:ion channel [Cytophagales bacterium]